jgi:multidrug efflux pump
LIWRRDRLPTITVRGNLYGKIQPATIVDRIAPEIGKIQAALPDGYRIVTGGSVEESGKGSASVMAGIPLFVLAVVTVLMIQLQSISRVSMVLLTAPLGIIGIALFLLLFNQPFGFMALLGTIALSGMIMRNSVISGRPDRAGSGSRQSARCGNRRIDRAPLPAHRPDRRRRRTGDDSLVAE